MITIDIQKSNKCNGDYSLFVSFPYDNKVVEVIRGLSERYWNAENKEWECAFKALPILVKELKDYEIEVKGIYVLMQKKKAVVPDGFNFKTKPYDHQIDGFNFGLENDRWLLGDEMGLGKTKQVIDIAVAKKLEKGYSHCLIICGVNGLKWNWKNEVATHSNENAWILGQRWKANRLVIGSNANKLCDVKALSTGQLSEHYFIITNVETFRSEDITKEVMKLCNNGTIGMIAFDECHKAKNPTSQQGKGILKLQAETMIAMTGTPLMNNPFDLYIILKWLGFEKHSFYAFKNHYANYGGYGGYQVMGYKNLDELEDRLDEIMLRRKKEEVLDLPEKIYIDEMVEMSPKQKQIYDEVTSAIKMNIDSIKMANNPLAELIRMRQATGYTGILSSTIKESAKLDRMEELVAEAVENGRKVVIFSNWTQMTTPIAERLRDYNPAVITGEIGADSRQQMLDKFQNDSRCKVIVGTSGAMGTGLNLYEGSVIIFVDHPWNRALYDQCTDRCHRIGQTRAITIYNLMCKGTIDERIWEIVNSKGAMSDALIDGKITKNKSELIEYLIG